MDEWRVCECWHKVCTLQRVWCSCVYIHPLIHHYPPATTSYWHNSFPTHLSLSFFPSHTHSHSLSRSLTTPSPWFRGFSWGRTLASCWASVTHSVRPWPASVDTAGHLKGALVQQCHSKLLAYSTTLKRIIYFTDSVGIVGCTVAEYEKYTFLKEKKKDSDVGKFSCVASALFSQCVCMSRVRTA